MNSLASFIQLEGVMERDLSRGFWRGVALVSFAALMQVATPSEAVECDRDQFSVHTLDGEVIAFSGLGGSRSIDLEREEEVLAKTSSGCVAMVSTTRRLLVISALAGAWTPIRYQLNESPAYELIIGDLVALAISDKRVIGYDPTSTRVVTANIASRETVTRWGAGASVAAVATDRRLIGFSAGLTSFVERSLRLGEEIEVIDGASDILTVITESRILTLRHGSGLWAERSRGIR